MTNIVRIPGGHWQERLIAGPLGRGFCISMLDEDGPTIMDATAPVAGKGGGTNKMLSK
jgi:hypothetical protein